ncbi:Response regulator receiver domain-containing protein [Roseomonas rosea]|uniref:Response regulator receiver domain-containing protein n=1 Tax=Muricoccus roseus TaxID=198092 RepID=A0A1M6SZF1_9PROT|nr:response regulator [Roseomonas rosea]SHK50094.1 Response regulator receiver domain-containing protein [Roseomonas rosea]
MTHNDCVLIVEDEFLIAELLTDMVEDMGLTVCACAATAEDATALAGQHRPRIVLMDVRLSGEKDGIDAALAIHHQVGSKVVFITGSQEAETVARIHQDHPAAILFKPITFGQLRQTIETISA